MAAPTLVECGDQGMFTEKQENAFVSLGAIVSRVDLANASHDAHLDAFLHPNANDR